MKQRTVFHHPGCLLVVTALLSLTVRAQTAPQSSDTSATELVWLDSLDAAFEDARTHRRPVFVDVGAEWCGWCKKLEEEIKKPEVQTTLKNWTLVRLDTDKQPEETKKLAVGPIPALRILSAEGRTVSARNGYVNAQDLIKWLDGFYKSATSGNELLGNEPKDAGEAQALVGRLTDPDALVREAATRLLLRRPDLAAPKIVDAFADGTLESRLAMLELLRDWKAPLDGIDPWEPSSITPARLEALRKWASTLKTPEEKPPGAEASLTPEQLSAARRDIALMLQAETPAEVLAARERLARLGRGLAAEVHTTLQAAAGERDRQRLAALRYRLAASDALAFAWSNGFEQLASAESGARHKALAELESRVSAADIPLLLALFADPDPFIRESSLRILRSIQDHSAAADILKLLYDPEPNVRAAVLKQLAESPVPGMEPEVIKFAATEKDADLVVHAVRVLREQRSATAGTALISLLGHESWRVRAEAAEGLGKIIEDDRGVSEEWKADVYVRMIALLDDPDGFVVSRAVLVLREARVPAAIEPLAKAAMKRPELAPDVVQALSMGGSTASTLKYLREFTRHTSPTVRSAAIGGLLTLDPYNVGPDLQTALQDPEPSVRIGTANAIMQSLASFRPSESIINGQLRKVNLETWLAKFRKGEGRPDWLPGLSPTLEKMLDAAPAGNPSGEAIAASIPLIALEKESKSMPILVAAAATDPARRNAAAQALPWLPWEQRIQLFKAIVSKAGQGEIGEYVQLMTIIPNSAAAPVMWDLLSKSTTDKTLLGGTYAAIRQLYLGDRYFSASTIDPKDLELLIQTALEKVSSGSDTQKLVALALLAEQAPLQAMAPAEKLLKERPATDPLKADAFQMLLIAKSNHAPAEAQALAVRALDEKDLPDAARKIALSYLVMGTESLSQLREAIYISRSGSVYYSSGQPIVVEVPQGLKAELLRPFAKGSDPVAAAHAGYLLALIGDRSGLEMLLSQWRKSPADHGLRRSVYRAISAIGDDSLTPVLVEVMKSFDDDDFYVRDFYWTIRSMKGPNVLQLRKDMRDRFGMDRLR